jgi:hypothetical protein
MHCGPRSYQGRIYRTAIAVDPPAGPYGRPEADISNIISPDGQCDYDLSCLYIGYGGPPPKHPHGVAAPFSYVTPEKFFCFRRSPRLFDEAQLFENELRFHAQATMIKS